jgi:hypothetical protein
MTLSNRFVFIVVGILLLTFISGCVTIASRALLPREGIRKGIHAAHIERGVVTMTRDEVPLVSWVYRPVTMDPTPTILVRLPFAKTLRNETAADVVGRFWAKRGYTVVIQGTRGRFRSGGEFYPLRNEQADGLDTLNWLARQSWFDGRLGMWGGSTFGYTQWVISDQTDPGPTALHIQIASTSFYDMFYPGGAFSLESALNWAVRSHGGRDRIPSNAKLTPGFEGFPLIEADDRIGEDIPFFNDWVAHQRRDEYWIGIDDTDRPERLRAPVLLQAGWFDPFLPAQIEDFLRIRKGADPGVAASSRLVIGPWAHARSVTLADGYKPLLYRKASLGPSIDWFDRHLRGDTSIPETAPVRIFVMGDNTWRDEQEWPLARVRYVPYYLSSRGHANSAEGDGLLTIHAPATEEPRDVYVYDPLSPIPTAGGAMIGPRAGVELQNDIETRADVLVYTTAALPEAIEVTGPITLVLHVGTTAPSTDFTAKLVDVHPDGKAFNVCDGILRRDYDAGTSEVTIHLWPTSHVFGAAHRIRLEVSSSNFPHYDRSPNTGGDIATETRPAKAVQTVHHDAAHPSRLVLPIIPR